MNSVERRVMKQYETMMWSCWKPWSRRKCCW